MSALSRKFTDIHTIRFILVIAIWMIYDRQTGLIGLQRGLLWALRRSSCIIDGTIVDTTATTMPTIILPRAFEGTSTT